MKLFRWGCLLVIPLLVFLSACSSSTDMTEIKLAEVTRSIFYTPQYVAIEKDFFADEGLDVEVKTTWVGDKTMTALLADHADIALVGSETSIYVYAQDASDTVINFAQLTQTDGTFLVSKSEHPDFSWEDTKGDVFLGQRKGGMPQMVGEYVLKQYGIDPHNDLEVTGNIEVENGQGACGSGGDEYVQVYEPNASMFEKEGKRRVIASFGEEAGSTPYTVAMTKESFINANEDVL